MQDLAEGAKEKRHKRDREATERQALVVAHRGRCPEREDEFMNEFIIPGGIIIIEKNEILR